MHDVWGFIDISVIKQAFSVSLIDYTDSRREPQFTSVVETLTQ